MPLATQPYLQLLSRNLSSQILLKSFEPPLGVYSTQTCRSALARVLFLEIYERDSLYRSMDLPSIKARLHPNLPLVWRRLLFYEDPTTEWWTLPVSAFKEKRTCLLSPCAKDHRNAPEWKKGSSAVEEGNRKSSSLVSIILAYPPEFFSNWDHNRGSILKRELSLWTWIRSFHRGGRWGSNPTSPFSLK